MLTQEQAAQYCGVSVPTFKRLCSVPKTALGESVERFDRRKLDEWLTARGQGGAAEANDDIDFLALAREGLRKKKGKL